MRGEYGLLGCLQHSGQGSCIGEGSVDERIFLCGRLQWKVSVFASALPTGPLPAIPRSLDASGLSWDQPTHLGADGRIERYDKDSYDYHRLSRVAKVNMGEV